MGGSGGTELYRLATFVFVQDSETHKRSTGAFAVDAESLASSAKDFREPSVGGHKKCRKMLWCIAEGNRDLKRELFQPGQGVDGKPVLISTTLYQDCRKGKLSVRFTTATSKNEKRHDHLGAVDLANDFVSRRGPCSHCRPFHFAGLTRPT